MKKLLAATAITGTVLIGSALTAKAVDQDIGASALFREAISLANVNDMDFGTIDYTGTAAGTVELDANGGTLTGSAGYTPAAATGTTGSFDINGATGQTVDISCETSGVISDNTNTLNLTSTEVRVDGSDTACAGLGTSPVAFVLTAGTDTVNVGATIDIPGGGIAAAGTYNTSNTSGDPVTVRVVYQ